MAIHLFNAKTGSLPWEALPETLRNVICETFLIEPKYAVHNISLWGENRWLISFGTMGSFSISSNTTEVIKKYNMSIQVPGNQDYLWSLSISNN